MTTAPVGGWRRVVIVELLPLAAEEPNNVRPASRKSGRSDNESAVDQEIFLLSATLELTGAIVLVTRSPLSRAFGLADSSPAFWSAPQGAFLVRGFPVQEMNTVGMQKVTRRSGFPSKRQDW